MPHKSDIPLDKHGDTTLKREVHAESNGRVNFLMLEGRLQEEVAERRRLELELEKLQRGTVTLEEQGERERGRSLGRPWWSFITAVAEDF